jgi:dynein heavy chain, axonemal
LSLEYKWFDVGVLDYDEPKKLFLVQKVNKNGRVVDSAGQTVVNGGLLNDGKSLLQVCASNFFFIWVF